MGFENKNSSPIKYFKILGLGKSEPQHYFEVSGQKLDVNTFSGKLVKISPSEYEFEGKIRQTVKMLFIDNMGEYYQTDISYTHLSRGMLNTILGYVSKQKTKKGKLDLELSLYINKDGFKSMGVKINNERGDWFISSEEQKKMIEIVKNSKGEIVSTDFSELDNFFKNHLQNISDFITIDNFIDEEPLPTIKTDEEISIEDIPF